MPSFSYLRNSLPQERYSKIHILPPCKIQSTTSPKLEELNSNSLQRRSLNNKSPKGKQILHYMNKYLLLSYMSTSCAQNNQKVRIRTMLAQFNPLCTVNYHTIKIPHTVLVWQVNPSMENKKVHNAQFSDAGNPILGFHMNNVTNLSNSSIGLNYLRLT